MGSHTTTGEWKSFEIRMRRRRAERLVLRADVAAAEGCLEEARALLDEARTLWSSVPGLADLERRIDAAAIPIFDTSVDDASHRAHRYSARRSRESRLTRRQEGPPPPSRTAEVSHASRRH